VSEVARTDALPFVRCGCGHDHELSRVQVVSILQHRTVAALIDDVIGEELAERAAEVKQRVRAWLVDAREQDERQLRERLMILDEGDE
jgi:hypothetical protein